MDKEDRNLILAIFGWFLFAAFVVFMAKASQESPPSKFIEFSPRDGVTCIKAGSSIACWRE